MKHSQKVPERPKMPFVSESAGTNDSACFRTSAPALVKRNTVRI